MARGGKRPGAGRKPGSVNRPRVATSLGTGTDASQAEQVALFVAAGMEPSEIATAMDLTPIELRAKFKRELKHGATIAKAYLIARLDAALARGNAGAAKQLLGIIGTGGQHEAEPPVDARTAAALRLINGGRA